jgi:hypothetical protein
MHRRWSDIVSTYVTPCETATHYMGAESGRLQRPCTTGRYASNWRVHVVTCPQKWQQSTSAVCFLWGCRWCDTCSCRPFPSAGPTQRNVVGLHVGAFRREVVTIVKHKLATVQSATKCSKNGWNSLLQCAGFLDAVSQGLTWAYVPATSDHHRRISCGFIADRLGPLARGSSVFSIGILHKIQISMSIDLKKK